MSSDPTDAPPAVATEPPERGKPRLIVRQVAVLALLAALGAIGYVGHHALRHLGPPERCWEYQEKDGRIYKVNPCTGQFQLIGDAAPPAQ